MTPLARGQAVTSWAGARLSGHVVSDHDVFVPGTLPVTATRLCLSEPAGAHVHDFLELGLVVGGNAVHTSEAGTTLLAPGRLVIIGPGGWHAYTPDPTVCMVVVRVGVPVLRSTLGWLGSLGGIGYLFDPSAMPMMPGAFVADLDPGVATAICPAMASLVGPATGTPIDALGRLARLLDVLSVLDGFWQDDDPDARRQAPGRREVAVAVRVLWQRIAEPWTLGRLAGEVYLSRSQLARLFGATFGIGPMSYLRELRVRRMADLLVWTEMPVSTVARSVGWADPRYASRCFNAYWHVSPTRYRQDRRQHARIG